MVAVVVTLKLDVLIPGARFLAPSRQPWIPALEQQSPRSLSLGITPYTPSLATSPFGSSNTTSSPYRINRKRSPIDQSPDTSTCPSSV